MYSILYPDLVSSLESAKCILLKLVRLFELVAKIPFEVSLILNL